MSQEYRDTQKKTVKFEKLLEKIENFRLLKLAESRVNNHTDSFLTFVNEQGFSMEELEDLSESVENEYGDLVVMSVETYESMLETAKTDAAISEAENKYVKDGQLHDVRCAFTSLRKHFE